MPFPRPAALLPLVLSLATGPFTPALAWHDGSTELHTHNMELVGYLGEIATKTDELAELVVNGNYVYMGSFFGPAGLFIVDVSDPTRPRLVGEFPQEDARVADVKVSRAGTIAVLSNEAFRRPKEGETQKDVEKISHLGVSIVDISDKRRPRLLSRFDNVDAQGKPHGVHNMFIDGDFLYLAGTGRGLVVVNISDPGNPKEIVNAPRPQVARDPAREAPRVSLHDLHVQRHPRLNRVFGYLAYWDAGLRIYDLTNPAFPLEAVTWAFDELGPSFLNTHYVRPSPSGDIVVVGPEFGRGFSGFLAIVDVRDFKSPKLLSTWSIPGHDWIRKEVDPQYAWSPHNFDVTEDRIYLGNYHAGVWVIDIADPSNPTTIASFGPESFKPAPPKPSGEDTERITGGIPFVWTAEEQDGLIYASDMPTGLYILRVTE